MIAAGLIALAMYAGACVEDYLFCRTFAAGAEGQLGRELRLRRVQIALAWFRATIVAEAIAISFLFLRG